MMDSHESVKVRDVFLKDANIKTFLLEQYSEWEMDLRVPPSKSMLLSPRAWLRLAEERWTEGRDIPSMPMAEFSHAMGLHGPPRAPSPAAEDEEEAYASPAAEGEEEEAEGEDTSHARAPSRC